MGSSTRASSVRAKLEKFGSSTRRWMYFSIASAALVRVRSLSRSTMASKAC